MIGLGMTDDFSPFVLVSINYPRMANATIGRADHQGWQAINAVTP